ncbi:hypothetical protein ACFQ1E_15540 [Sphingomonas canadensis]|uniref:Secreted protein n=1 Tax=Sphingomonas canadensis TaxID=1219257 RepID=A0ABW3H8C8_9SPHN|nr:hypothetical protein [Sphingomonas canadensis]MCW3837384.1 hypothetical protein [Sphingomonas canadensis]
MKLFPIALALAAPLALAPLGAAAPVAAVDSAPGVAVAAKGRGLCKPGETVVFSCRSGTKTISVCGGTANGANYAQYRFGTAKKLELSYPASGTGTMQWARTGYSGGGEAQVSFTSGSHGYTVYSRTVRTNFDARGNMPEFSSGVLVRKDGKQIRDISCTPRDSGNVDADAAAKFMPEGEIVYPED